MIVPTNQPARVLYALLKLFFWWSSCQLQIWVGIPAGPGSCLGLPPCHSTKSTKQTTLYDRSGSGADPHDVDPQSLENCDRNIQLGTQKPWKTYQLSEIVVISSCSLVVWNGTGHFTGASKGRGPLGELGPLVAPVSTTSFKISGWWFGTFFIFPYIGNNHPNWLSYFSEGLKPPTRYELDPPESRTLPHNVWVKPSGTPQGWYVSAVYPMWHIPAWVHCVTASPFWVSCFMTDFGWNHFF